MLLFSIEQQIIDAKEEIAACKEELQQAKVVRKNKQGIYIYIYIHTYIL